MGVVEAGVDAELVLERNGPVALVDGDADQPSAGLAAGLHVAQQADAVLDVLEHVGDDDGIERLRREVAAGIAEQVADALVGVMEAGMLEVGGVDLDAGDDGSRFFRHAAGENADAGADIENPFAGREAVTEEIVIARVAVLGVGAAAVAARLLADQVAQVVVEAEQETQARGGGATVGEAADDGVKDAGEAGIGERTQKAAEEERGGAQESRQSGRWAS